MRALSVVLLLLIVVVKPAHAAPSALDRWSVALEGDGIAYGLGGYSGILQVAAPNGFEVALGSGRYTLPEFVTKTQDTYNEAGWDATSESIQVFRMGYRFAPPLANGFALHAIALHQRFRISSEKLAGVSASNSSGLASPAATTCIWAPATTYTRSCRSPTTASTKARTPCRVAAIACRRSV